LIRPYYLLFLLAGGMVVSCKTQREEKPQDISFEQKTINTAYPEGCKSSDSTCTYFHVSYPQFAGLDSAVLRKLTAMIDTSLVWDNKEERGKPMRQQATEFIASYIEVRNTIPDLNEVWYYTGDVTPQRIDDKVLSVAIHGEYYTGGAHGSEGKHFININPSTGAVVALGDILKDNYEQQLTLQAEKNFREKYKLSSTASLQENGFDFPDDAFQLTDNYGFTDEGIVFYYNNYEIAAYVNGPTELVVPYQSLGELLR